jgi:hexosaminidase
MNLVLLPQPHRIAIGKGRFTLPISGTMGVSSRDLYPAVGAAGDIFTKCSVSIGIKIVPGVLQVVRRKRMKPGGYRLRITDGGILLEVESVTGAFSGIQTLKQIVSQCEDRTLPHLLIDDWPDFADRGVYYDVTRGRVPKIESLMQQVELLSQHKINQFQLYIEHTFRFRGHPDIGKGASPLTAADILGLDAYCRNRGVELVPSLASFGHLSGVLRLPRYRHLAEDWGIGKYTSPDAEKLQPWQRRIGWTLSPANPETYEFLDSLFSEFLPLFSSERFNICCDETWDLGLGQSYELCKKKGKGRVYLDHIIKLRDLAAKYGKRIMFWGDIVRNHPELIKHIPKDVTILDWGYASNHNFEAIRDFRKAGLEFFACPGTSSWCSLFPRLHEATANIHGFAAAGRKHGARGLLTTDWGDGGHYNFMEYSWHGYLFGAEQAWNVNADTSTFTRRFCKLFLKIDDPAFVKAVGELGDISHLQFGRFYQSIWQHIFFATPQDQVFQPTKDAAFVCRAGKITRVRMTLDSRLGRETLKRLGSVRKVFARTIRKRNIDPHKILPYWLFAVNMLIHSAKKLAAFGKGGKASPATRKALRKEMNGLMQQFKRLWSDRNRPSEIRITLARYRKAICSL